jgi:hypothetical protein
MDRFGLGVMEAKNLCLNGFLIGFRNQMELLGMVIERVTFCLKKFSIFLKKI